MQDTYHRNIDYLRVSVTDRCNYRCLYCMPPSGVALREHRDILRYEEFLRLIDIFGRAGIRKIRLTGGEPLVRKGLSGFIRSLTALGTIEDLSLTTNGSLLAEKADELKKAGLQRVNISLDTVDPLRFKAITGNCGRIEDVIAGIDAALQADLTPLKLNVVLSESFQPSDLEWFLRLTYQKPVHVRFIEYMPIGNGSIKGGLSIEKVKALLAKAAGETLQTLEKKMLGQGPARYYSLPGLKGSFGFIAPLTEHFCAECNRLRLTADGKLKPCLLSDEEVDLAAELRSGADDERLLALFRAAVRRKPDGHKLGDGGIASFQRSMSQIGG